MKKKDHMKSFGDPILLFLQFKSFQTNQMNDFKAKLSKIDPNASLHLANKFNEFPYFCKSSTFVLNLPKVSYLEQIFVAEELKENVFIELKSTQLECILVGVIFENKNISLNQLKKLFKLNLCSFQILAALAKTNKLVPFLKSRLTSLPMILKANNGN